MAQVQQVKAAIGEDPTLSRLLSAMYYGSEFISIQYFLLRIV
jgi:hypothetical protein